MGGDRWETVDGRWEMGDGKQERRDGRQEMGVGRRETGDVVRGNKGENVGNSRHIFVASPDNESFLKNSQHPVPRDFLPLRQ